MIMKATKQTLLRASGIVFALGVAASPVMAAAATDSDNTVINATIGSTITVATSSPVALGLTPTSGAVTSVQTDTVTVNTNNSAGYSLTLKDADTAAELNSGTDTIAAHAATTAAPSALADNSWGFAVANNSGGAGAANFDASYTTGDNQTANTNTFAGMPASSGTAVELRNTSTTAVNDFTTVYYGVKVDTTQPTGVYTDTVTYTATTK